MVAKFKTSLDAAHTAAVAGDYVTAVRHMRAARIAMLGIPKSELDREKIEMNVEDVDNMIRDLERQANAQRMPSGRPWQEMPIVYTRH